MRKLFAPLIGIAVFIAFMVFLAYVFPPLMEFLAWWFVAKEAVSTPLSTGQTILIDIVTHLITYASVSVIFVFLGWWNKDAMHIVYVVVSEVISLLLALLLRFIIDYYWILFIILGALLITAIVLFVIIKFKEKKEEEDD